MSIPLAWYPKFATATEEQRNHWRWLGGSVGIHWPKLDEDLSIRGLLVWLERQNSIAASK